MKKEYVVRMSYFNGNRDHKEFSNKRAARSFAWNWINQQKAIIRDRNGSRNYKELHAVIDVYYPDKEISKSIEYYD